MRSDNAQEMNAAKPNGAQMSGKLDIENEQGYAGRNRSVSKKSVSNNCVSNNCVSEKNVIASAKELTVSGIVKHERGDNKRKRISNVSERLSAKDSGDSIKKPYTKNSSVVLEHARPIFPAIHTIASSSTETETV